MGGSRAWVPARPPMRMGEARHWVPAGLAGGGRTSSFAISSPDPNSHVVCLTDWLVNRTLRNFFLSFNDQCWAEVSRSLCLLGVLCLKHLAVNPDFIWGNCELAELVDYIQRENRWPEELIPEARRRGESWVAPWCARKPVARTPSHEPVSVAQPQLHHHNPAPRHGTSRGVRSVSATGSRRRRPSTAGSSGASSRCHMQPSKEPDLDHQISPHFCGSREETRSVFGDVAPITAACHYSQCGDLLTPCPTARGLHSEDVHDATFSSEGPVFAFPNHTMLSAEPRARLDAVYSQRHRPEPEQQSASSSLAAAQQLRRMSRAPSAPLLRAKTRRSARHSDEHGYPSSTTFVQRAAGPDVSGQSRDASSRRPCRTDCHDGARAKPRRGLVLADDALQACSELCEPRLARGGWCASVPFQDADIDSMSDVERPRRESSSALQRNHSCGRSAASTTAPIAASESHSASESPTSTLSSRLSLGPPCAGSRGSSMR